MRKNCMGGCYLFAKKFLGLILVLTMIMSFAPITASAYNGTQYGDLYYKVTDNNTVTITDCSSTATAVTIPSKINDLPVTSIGGWAFSQCYRLMNITIPISVKNIEYHAFEFCESLTSVELPNSVTSIGDYAFYRCSELTSINIPNRVTSIGNFAFEGCGCLKNITLFDDLTSIGDYAFTRCESLTKITIPNGVISVGKYAFYSCTSLTSVELPNSVTSIGGAAFGGCSSLTSIDVDINNNYYLSMDGVLFNKNKTTIVCYPVGKNDDSYTIPNSVTSIGDDAFGCCKSLTKIIIPDGVTSIGNGAFISCSSLANMTIPNSVIGIGESAFINCSNLANMTIPNSVTSIDYGAFYDCTSLKDVYYGGSEQEWEKIEISYCNDNLINATIHYNQSSALMPAEIETVSLISLASGVYSFSARCKTDTSGVLVVVLYKNGEMIGYTTENVSSDFSPETVSVGAENGADNAKFFIWDSLTTMRPLSGVCSIKI